VRQNTELFVFNYVQQRGPRGSIVAPAFGVGKTDAQPNKTMAENIHNFKRSMYGVGQRILQTNMAVKI